jgi:hypothetical protein
MYAVGYSVGVSNFCESGRTAQELRTQRSPTKGLKVINEQGNQLTPISFTLGNAHAVFDLNGEVYTWGDNTLGMRRSSKTTTVKFPVEER